MFTLRLQNNTGTTVTALNVHWTTWTFNDQDRANDFRFLFSSDNLTYASAESALTVVSPTLADTAPDLIAAVNRILAEESRPPLPESKTPMGERAETVIWRFPVRRLPAVAGPLNSSRNDSGAPGSS